MKPAIQSRRFRNSKRGFLDFEIQIRRIFVRTEYALGMITVVGVRLRRQPYTVRHWTHTLYAARTLRSRTGAPAAVVGSVVAERHVRSVARALSRGPPLAERRRDHLQQVAARSPPPAAASRPQIFVVRRARNARARPIALGNRKFPSDQTCFIRSHKGRRRRRTV